MNIFKSLAVFSLFCVNVSNAQVGVGVPAENIHPSAELEVKSNTKGFLPPRMTKVERDAIVKPAAGLLIYQTDGDVNNPAGLYYFDGTDWKNGAGVQGIKGDNGVKGDVGPKGDKGDTGAQGVQGAQGQNTLAKTTTEAAGANCITGGVKIEYGFDANNSGTLDEVEINPNLTKYVCNGIQGPIGEKGLQGPKGDTPEVEVTVSLEGDTLRFENGSYVIIPGISAANLKTKPVGSRFRKLLAEATTRLRSYPHTWQHLCHQTPHESGLQPTKSSQAQRP